MPVPSFFFFDMGNVLLGFDHERSVQQLACLTGVSAAVVRNEVFGDDGLEWPYERGDLTRGQFFENFCERTGWQPSGDEQAFHQAHADIFWPLAATADIVQQLKRLGLRLGVLSNTCDGHWEFAQQFAAVRAFERATLSFQVGGLKPHAEIYQAAERLAGVPPHEIFFVDDRAENVDAARALGWQAVPFTTAEELARALVARGVPLV